MHFGTLVPRCNGTCCLYLLKMEAACFLEHSYQTVCFSATVICRYWTTYTHTCVCVCARAQHLNIPLYQTTYFSATFITTCVPNYMYIILIKFGIPMKLVRLIKMCLNKTYSRVWMCKHLSDMFPFRNGLNKEMFFCCYCSTLLWIMPLGGFR
jgi:hypothetical protein